MLFFFFHLAPEPDWTWSNVHKIEAVATNYNVDIHIHIAHVLENQEPVYTINGQTNGTKRSMCIRNSLSCPFLRHKRTSKQIKLDWSEPNEREDFVNMTWQIERE